MIAERHYAEGIERFFADRLQLVKPEFSRMLVSKWAEEKRILPRGISAMAGPYRFEVTPYLREIADCFSESSPVRRVAIMKGARVGCTVGVIENFVGYAISQAPAPILLMGADKESAESSTELRIDAMLASAGLSPLIFAQTEKKANKGTGDRRALKQFPGGFLMSVGPNVASKLRNFGAKYLLFDEVDGYPMETQGEGDPISLATRRSDEYESSRKILYVSTPKDEMTSKIKPLWEAGDRRFYEVPCVHCGHFQRLEWRDANGAYRIKYDLDTAGHLDEESVRYICSACGKGWKNSDKATFLPLGRWVPTAVPEEPNFRSYHISSLYSPIGMRSWQNICREWIKTKGDSTKLKPFINTVLGEPWIEKGEAPDAVRVRARRDSYMAGTLPPESNALFCTVGADVQDDRVEAEVLAHARDGQTWSVNYFKFHGKTEYIDGECWREFEAMLKEKHAGLQIMLAAIDSRHWTKTVCQFCERLPMVFPLAGESRVARSGRIYLLKKLDEFPALRRIDLHAHELKVQLYSSLRMPQPEPGKPYPPGYAHFPFDYSDRYFEQLTSEEFMKVRAKNGGIQMLWRTTPGRRNEAHDCRVYAMCARLVWQQLVSEETFGQEEVSTTQFWDYVETQLAKQKIAQAGGVKK